MNTPNPPVLPGYLPLTEAQDAVLDDLRRGRGLCGHSTRVIARLRVLTLVEHDGTRWQLTPLGRRLATVRAEHRLRTHRRRLGYGAVAGSGQRYGVSGACSCRNWEGHSNEAPSLGGAAIVARAHAAHLTEILDIALPGDAREDG